MKKCILFLVVALLLTLAGTATPLAAQEAGSLAQVLTVEVPLANIPQYEAAVKELFAVYGEAEFEFPIFARVDAGNPGLYSFATLLNDYADLAADPELDEATAAALSKVTAASNRVDVAVWEARADLSYVPSSPRVATDAIAFTHITYLRPYRGKALELEKVMVDASKMYSDKGIADGLDVWQLSIGNDGPVYAVLVTATGEADYYNHAEKNQATLGGDWGAIVARTAPLLRSIEREGTVERPDLAYQP